MKKQLGISLSIYIVIVAFLSLIGGSIHAASTARISVDPKVIGAKPTESFSVDVVIADVADLYGWQLNLTFNPSVLEATGILEGPFLAQFGTSMLSAVTLDNTAGYAFTVCALLDVEAPGASGSGVLAIVNFQVKTAGVSPLHFSGETGLRTIEGGMPAPLPKELVDGVFGYPRDLAVTGLAASSSSVLPGETVSLNATVKNKGVVDEICNVTFYRDSAAIGNKTNIALDSEDSTSAVFAWDTTGVAAGTYSLRAEVSTVSGENDTENNVFSDGTLTIELVHDVAVTGLTVSPTSVPSGGQVSVNVTVFNKGSGTESFSVTVSCNDTTVGTKDVAALAPGNSEILTFTWETKDMALGNYILTATASSVSGETSTEDNVFSNVSLQITNPSFTLPIEWIIAIIAVVAVVIIGVFVFMRRRSKKA